MTNEVLVLIPARYESLRFPGKPLSKILGRPMIDWVYAGASRGWKKYSPTIAVVTNHNEIEYCSKELGHNVIRVDDDVSSGSERIALAWKRHFSDKDFLLVINLQGDEPLINGEDLEGLTALHLEKKCDIATIVRRREIDSDFTNPDIVKTVFRESDSKCLYFSRAAVPYNKDKEKQTYWFQHIGLYSYLPEALEKFCAFPKGKWEESEGLEQLRALENEMTISALELNKKLIGVDRKEDIEKVERELQNEKQ